MKFFIFGIALFGLAVATNASVQIPQRPVQQQRLQHPEQQSKRTEVDAQEEEPHPYTVSFFVFPHGAAQDLLGIKNEKKSKLTHKKASAHTKNNSSSSARKANATAYKPWSSEDLEGMSNYQQGSIKHPKSEMYPTCHQCKRNSTYHECIQKKTLLKCNDGLANICFTRSVKRDEIVHYEMGCATHKQCQFAKAKPCKLSKKKCFTCCQWSGCNSQSHHHKDFPFAYGRDDTTELSFEGSASTTSLPWVMIALSLLVCYLF